MPSTSTPPPEKEPKQTMEEKIAEAEAMLAAQSEMERLRAEMPSYERLLKLTTAQIARLDLWDNHYGDTISERAHAELRAWREACSRPAISGSR